MDDIREEFDIFMNKRRKITEKIKNLDSSDEDEHRLYGLISSGPLEIDELVEKTNIEVGRLSVILLRMQLKKLIKALPGRQFTGA